MMKKKNAGWIFGLVSAVLFSGSIGFSATYYVNAARPDDSGDGTSWGTSKKTIQAAVDLATTNDSVWVTDGVYNLGGRVASSKALTNRLYISEPILVQSMNGSEYTTISGAPGTNGSNDLDSIRGVYMENGASLVGFTVTSGYTINFQAASGSDQQGAGLWVGEDCVVSNCVISGNVTDWDGGGAYLDRKATLINCTLTENRAHMGGGVFADESRPKVTDCLVSNNIATYQGGGVRITDYAEVLRCTIVDNTSDGDGGGVYSWETGTITECHIARNHADNGAGAYMYGGAGGGRLLDCTLEENEATVDGGGLYMGYNTLATTCMVKSNSANQYGGGAYLKSSGTLDGCVLAGNTVLQQGGGAYLKDGGTVRSCTLSQNESVGTGGGIRFNGGGTLQNSIVWDNLSNTNGQNVAIYGKAPAITYSCAPEGLTHGVDNCITNDPIFNDPATINLQLMAGSPCVNTGDNNAWSTVNDIAGNPRQSSGVLDMGAYERPAAPIFVITTTAGVNGTLSPTNPAVTQGLDQTILIQPLEGYRMASLTVDTVSIVPMVGSYTFTNVQATHTIAATFAANPDVLYVNSARADDSGDGISWATAKKTIQAAVDAVTSGGTVWVTNGTYDLGGRTVLGAIQTNRVCITRPMTVRSVNGSDFTAIVGAAGSNGSNDSDSVRGVCMMTNSALIGFTVANGYSVNTGDYTYDRPGAGIWLTTDSVVSNCVISGNTTASGGGGVYLHQGGLLTHSTVNGNVSQEGGGGVSLNYGGVVSDCTVSNNTDAGYNGGGGAKIDGMGGVINRCVIQNNSAQSAGGVILSYGGELNNCLVVGNVASEDAGGVSGSECILNNCTIVGNSVTNSMTYLGGGGFSSGMMGMAELNNCIVWGNTSPTNSNLALSEYGMDTVRNSCAPAGEGITNGVNGCTTSDPLFVSVATTNYQLQVASPCKNTGDNTYAPAGTDLAGNIRINNSVVDMGAYEQTTVLPQYVITTTAGANGMMLPENPSVFQGSEQRITIHPQVAYKIESLAVDGSPITVTNEYTFTNVQSAHTIAATFALDPDALHVENVSVSQREGTKLVDISYDLSSAATNQATVSLFVSNGVSPVSVSSLSGDVGSDTSTGTGNSILWDMGADWNGQAATLVFHVVAEAGMLPEKPDAASKAVDARDYVLTVSSAQGSPVPTIGTHSSYCWKSVVTCSVDSVVAYTNTGWTGTGSVPMVGTTRNTGAITLSVTNSSIVWDWSFLGYELTVQNGAGSGFYANGASVPISAPATRFHQWLGDHLANVASPTSAVTTFTMPAEPTTLTPSYRLTNVYVKASGGSDSNDGSDWDHAKKTIQSGVDQVTLYGTVWVTNGLYQLGGSFAPGSTHSNRVCITRPITVRSVNGADATIISGNDYLGGIRGVYMTNGCSLIGFTVQESSAAGDIPLGGGIFLTENCIADSCVVVSNWADWTGGGVFLYGGGELTRSIVRGNATDVYGGGVGMLGGTVNDCLVYQNQGGGQYDMASGIHMEGGEVYNSTIVSNGPWIKGGISGSGVVGNCIVWGNHDSGYPNEIPDIKLTNGVVTNVCAQYGVTNGVNGCITSDPQFVNRSAGNFQLLETSPCVDVGDNADAPAGKDLADSARIINGTVDLGAYERFVMEADDDLNGFPNWWELRFFGSPVGAPPWDAPAANGVNTHREMFIAGLDPNDPAAEFITRVGQFFGGDPVIRWELAHGRRYSVYWTPNLMTPFTLLKSNVLWTTEGFVDRRPEADGGGFYKIDVRLDD